MGENLFDDLARALAEPVPRSRALRLMGSILVAASLPGAAFARSSRPARRTGFTCKKEDGYGEQRCCSGDTCCGEKECCALGSKCDPDGYCIKCPRPLVRCGPKCCQPGSKCCRRPKNDNPAGFPASDRFICCKPPNDCDDGICACPSGKEICGRLCCKRGEHCSSCMDSGLDAGTTYMGRRKCCPKGKECCGKTCVDKTLTCCQGKPCPASKPYCSETGSCCAEEQFAILDNGIGICCPAGTVATADGSCCPPGQASC